MKYIVLILLLAGCAPEGVDLSKRQLDIALVQAANGTLKTPLTPKREEVMDFTFQVPYARTIEPFRKIAHRKFFNLLRERESTNRLDRSIPIYGLQLPSFEGASTDYAYMVSPLSTQVVALHEKNSATFNERDLQTNEMKTRRSSKVFGKDLSVRYLATAGGAGAFGLCLNLPGENIGADPAKLPSTAQEIHEPYRTVPFEVKADTVAATFDFARACFALPIGKHGDADDGDLETRVSSPQHMGPIISSDFNELSEPLKNFYAKKFAKNDKEEKSDKEGKFLDGSWIIDERKSYLNKTGQSLKDDLDYVFHRISVPETAEQLKQVLDDTCRRMKYAGGKTYTDQIDSFCRNETDKFKVKSVALPEKDSLKSGCYQGFARVHEKSQALGSCQVEVHLRIQMTDKEDRQPLGIVLREFISQSISADWLAGVRKLGLDPLEFAMLLEEWDDEGQTRIEERNWRDDFPRLVEDIRTELAKD